MAEAKKATGGTGAAPKAKKPRAAESGTKPPAAKRAQAAKASASGKTVKVRLVRSGIGTPKDQRATLKGLGLTRLHQERELVDSAPLQGMLRKVRHLVSVNGQPAA